MNMLLNLMLVYIIFIPLLLYTFYVIYEDIMKDKKIMIAKNYKIDKIRHERDIINMVMKSDEF